MIKKLSLKFVLVFLVLVVSVIITSSCYAIEQNYIEINSLADYDLTLEDFINRAESCATSNGYNFSDFSDVILSYYFNNKIYVEFYDFYDTSSDNIVLRSEVSNNSTFIKGTFYDSLGNSGLSCSRVQVYYTISSASYTSVGVNEYTGSDWMSWYYGYGFKLIDETNILVYYESDSVPKTLIYEPSVNIDTSFDYFFEGITRGQTKLSINNLDSSLNMYGYVGLDTTFSVGDTLDTTANINNLRLMASRADNSDLNCYLYESEELNYYIVDENNVILDTGYISEMAKGYFLYSFEVYNGVDFVFLKDGQVYWSNDLTFKYSVGSSSEHEKNDVVSMGVSSYIVTDKTVFSNSYNGFVYDSSNNLIAQASTVISNDLSSISISVDTSYYEVHTFLKHYSCYWLKSFELDGTNKDGSYIDFSSYYAKWSIPTWLELKSITIDFEEYSKRNGIITGFSSAGSCSMFNLEIFEFLSDHKMSFDIKLEIYDSEDNLVLTHLINSDDIVKNQIASDENNVDKGDYDIVDNPNYTGGSSGSPDINNIQNWTADDYANLMSTDNFVWEFFKAILGNLPWWITTPLTILLFGVVIITLIRFARGA